MSHWVCLNINAQQAKKAASLEDVEQELRKAFDGDFLDWVVVGDWFSDDSVDLSFDSYTFVKCEDYFQHVRGVQGCRYVAGVLNSYHNPAFSTEKEVARFRRKIQGQASCYFRRGDMVEVREGYLKNLFGVVLGRYGRMSYWVLFKFHTRCFVRVISTKNMDFKKNLFDKLKFPVRSTRKRRKYPLPDISPDVLASYITTIRKFVTEKN